MNKSIFLILLIPSLVGGILSLGSPPAEINSIWSMIGAIGASLIGAIVSASTTNKTNSTSVSEAQKNRDWQEDMQEDQQAFQSLESLRQRAWTENFTKEMAINGLSWEMEGAKKAGLNPYSVVDSAGSVQTASGGASAGSASAPSGAMPNIQKNDVGSIISSLVGPLSQLEVNESVAEKNKSDAKRTTTITPHEVLKIQSEINRNAEAAGLDKAESDRLTKIFDYEIKKLNGEISNLDLLGQGLKLDNDIKAFNVKYAEQEKLNQLALIVSQIGLNNASKDEKIASARKLLFEGNLLDYDETQLANLKEYVVKKACYDAGISEEEYQFLTQTRDVRVFREWFGKSEIGGLASDVTQIIMANLRNLKAGVDNIRKNVDEVFKQRKTDPSYKGLDLTGDQIVNGASQ